LQETLLSLVRGPTKSAEPLTGGDEQHPFTGHDTPEGIDRHRLATTERAATALSSSLAAATSTVHASTTDAGHTDDSASSQPLQAMQPSSSLRSSLAFSLQAAGHPSSAAAAQNPHLMRVRQAHGEAHDQPPTAAVFQDALATVLIQTMAPARPAACAPEALAHAAQAETLPLSSSTSAGAFIDPRGFSQRPGARWRARLGMASITGGHGSPSPSRGSDLLCGSDGGAPLDGGSHPGGSGPTPSTDHPALGELVSELARRLKAVMERPRCPRQRLCDGGSHPDLRLRNDAGPRTATLLSQLHSCCVRPQPPDPSRGQPLRLCGSPLTGVQQARDPLRTPSEICALRVETIRRPASRNLHGSARGHVSVHDLRFSSMLSTPSNAITVRPFGHTTTAVRPLPGFESSRGTPKRRLTASSLLLSISFRACQYARSSSFGFTPPAFTPIECHHC